VKPEREGGRRTKMTRANTYTRSSLLNEVTYDSDIVFKLQVRFDLTVDHTLIITATLSHSISPLA
jgi:hypothetical protein